MELRRLARFLVCATVITALWPCFARAQLITISGRISDPDGAAAPGVQVELQSLGGGGQVTTTDTAGDYRVDLLPGAIRVSLRPDPATRLAEYNAWIGSYTASSTWDYTLRLGSLVEGTLSLPDGRPAGGPPVTFDPATWFMPDGEWLEALPDFVDGSFSIVVPRGVYRAFANPPKGLYRRYEPIDASAGDVSGVEIGFNTRLVPPYPELPPDLTKITIGPPDDLGEGLISGVAGAVEGLAHVMLVNLDGLQQAHTLSAADGSFSTQLFAPPGSSVLIKHGSEPMVSWNSVATGVSMDLSWFPGTIVQVPFDATPVGERVPFAVVGPLDFAVDFDPSTENSVGAAWTASGTIGPSPTLHPGDPFDIVGTLGIVAPGIDSMTDPSEISFAADVLLHMIFDVDGRPVGPAKFMSTWLTPTGFPIQGSTPPTPSAGFMVTADAFAFAGGHTVKSPMVGGGELPAGLPAGIYRPVLAARVTGVPTGAVWTAAEVYGVDIPAEFVRLPPVVVESTDPVAPPHLVWRLLQENPMLGTRGVGALEDRGTFQLSQMITSQGAPFIVSPTDTASGMPLSYRLEPYLPAISFADRRIPSRPLIPFALPGGSLHVIVEEPDGGVRELGPAPFRQSLNQSRTTNSGGEFNVGTTQLTDVYSLTTLDDDFVVAFDEYGRHTVFMDGWIGDLWGNVYTGGGTYELWVAHPLDIDPGVLPGTPFEVGDAFNPTVRVHPRVPAEVEITVTQYPDSDPAAPVVHTLRDGANQYGLLATADASVTFEAPGEYRVDLAARYRSDDGELWMGAATWGGVVMSPESEAVLVARGRRGVDSLPAIPPSWFVASRDLNVPGQTVSHILNPYYDGDLLWSRMADAAVGGDSLVIAASVFDAAGELSPTIRARADLMHIGTATPGTLAERFDAGEIPLFSSTSSGGSVLLAPDDVDQVAYSYRSSQRPGVRVREVVTEDAETGGYWRLDTQYDDQPGVGTLGDLPNDFKFQYVGTVFRDLVTGHSEYGGQGTGWVFIPDDDVLGTRVMPPFAGPGNGGWTTEGGPIMTVLGEDIHLFVHPTGTPPGAVLEVGDTLRFAGHLMPTLPSRVSVSVTSPAGAETTFELQGNRVGYVYDPTAELVVDEPGVWVVDVDAWHDGLCSGGRTIPPYPHGSILGADSGRYDVYVVEREAARLEVAHPRPGILTPVAYGGAVEPIVVTGPVPSDLQQVTVEYTLTMAGWILEHGSATVERGRYTVVVDPVSLSASFPNLDLEGRDEARPGLSDTLSLALMLRGQSSANVKYRANTVTLQGQQVFVGGDGRGLVAPPAPRRSAGRRP